MKDFIKEVQLMRELQVEYFETRHRTIWQLLTIQEHKVDEMIKKHFSNQLDIFDR